MCNMSRDATRREVFLDARGNGRALRLTWHHDADLVVLSLWRDSTCAGTFRLPKGQVNDFVDALVDGLREEVVPIYEQARPEFMSWAFDQTDEHIPAG
jgi:hypothetical protein